MYNTILLLLIYTLYIYILRYTYMCYVIIAICVIMIFYIIILVQPSAGLRDDLCCVRRTMARAYYVCIIIQI